MKPNAVISFKPKALLIFMLAIGSLGPALVQAQQVYRIVGLDGRVTFSDQPPALNSAKVVTNNAGSAPGNAAPTGLPFELRQVALKFPVVLYTADNCVPCAAGRVLLTGRGVPFSEKTILTAADADALQRLSGASSLPFLTIGSQRLSGFSDVEWMEFLNAAGYPKSSLLPPSYRPPAAVPLVVVNAMPAGEAKPAVPAKTAAVVRPVQPAFNSSNPSGIKF